MYAEIGGIYRFEFEADLVRWPETVGKREWK